MQQGIIELHAGTRMGVVDNFPAQVQGGQEYDRRQNKLKGEAGLLERFAPGGCQCPYAGYHVDVPRCQRRDS